MDPEMALAITIVIGTGVLLSCVLISVGLLMAFICEWEFRKKLRDARRKPTTSTGVDFVTETADEIPPQAAGEAA